MNKVLEGIETLTFIATNQALTIQPPFHMITNNVIEK
jgi:hypothetical protein